MPPPPDNLIAQLRAHHAEIKEAMAAVEAASAAEDLPALVARIETFKQLTIAHLALEDSRLYPGLEQLAREVDDASMVNSARLFASNMLRITEALLEFLGRHSGPGMDLAAFKAEWPNIARILAVRIGSEETSLYPLYERALKRG